MTPRRGFSLVELLVVVAVLVLVGGLALRGWAAVSTVDPQQVAARLQSRMQGLRERARHGGRPAGVRLIRATDQPELVVGVSGLQAGDRLRYGGSDAPLQFERGDPATGEVTRVRGLTAGCDWEQLVVRGHLKLPARMRIPAGRGEWYSVVDVKADPNQPGETLAELATPLDEGLVVQAAPARVATPAGSPWATCEVETLATGSLESERLDLPPGVVIDLRQSRLPEGWDSPAVNLDMVCDSRGVFGELGRGPLVLVLRPRPDAGLGLDLASAECTGAAVAVVLWPGTGRAGVSPIDPTDVKNNETGAAGADGLADDPLRMALATGGER